MPLKKDTQDWILLALSSLSLIGLAVLDASCTRDTGGSATLTLTLPSSSSISASSSAIHDLSWGQTAPTTFTGLNCFFVMVSGPESSMTGNSCNLGNGTVYPVGVVGGSFGAGSTINMQVPAGQNRTVNIVGLYSDGAVACPNLSTINTAQTHFSNPVFLGSVGGVNMADGASVNVTVPVTATITNSTNALGNCSGPLFNNNGGGGGGGAPVGLAFRMQDNLTNFLNNTCVPANVVIVDSANNNASVSGSYTAVIAGTNGASFWQDATCSSLAQGTTLNFNSFSTIGFFVKMPSTPTTFSLSATYASGSVSLTAANSNLNTVSTTSAPYRMHMVDVRNITSITTGYNFPGAYVCKPYLQQMQDANGIPVPFSMGGTITSAYDYFYPESSSMVFTTSSTDSLCATTTSNTPYITSGTQSYTNSQFYAYIVSMASPSPVSIDPYILGSPSTNPFTITPYVGGAFASGGIVNDQNQANSTSFNFSAPTSCNYVGEIAAFDASQNRIAGGGGAFFMSGNYLTFTGLTSGFLYSDSSCTSDLSGGTHYTGFNGATVRLPLYAKSSATAGTYTISFSMYNGSSVLQYSSPSISMIVH